VFASRDEAGKKLVLVLLNFGADRPERASVALEGCVAPKSVKSFVYTGGPQGFSPGELKLEAGKLVGVLPPSSISVVEAAMP
jgi:hypothetical protein